MLFPPTVVTHDKVGIIGNPDGTKIIPVGNLSINHPRINALSVVLIVKEHIIDVNFFIANGNLVSGEPDDSFNKILFFIIILVFFFLIRFLHFEKFVEIHRIFIVNLKFLFR